ncbi:uncharacterized protein METZ01_LOCUS143019, partial [marine metagenome]
ARPGRQHRHPRRPGREVGGPVVVPKGQHPRL